MQVWKRLCVAAVTAVGLAAPATPAWAMNQAATSTSCHTYGSVLAAPKGTIPATTP
jgi:hypothetical protein